MYNIYFIFTWHSGGFICVDQWLHYFKLLDTCFERASKRFCSFLHHFYDLIWSKTGGHLQCNHEFEENRIKLLYSAFVILVILNWCISQFSLQIEWTFNWLEPEFRASFEITLLLCFSSVCLAIKMYFISDYIGFSFPSNRFFHMQKERTRVSKPHMCWL